MFLRFRGRDRERGSKVIREQLRERGGEEKGRVERRKEGRNIRILHLFI